MKIGRAIDLLTLERDYLLKKNEPESKQIRSEIAQALEMAVYALKAVQSIEQVIKYKGGRGNE